MKKLFLFPAIGLLLALPGLAQDYRFQVHRNVSWVVIDSAGRATIYYDLTFGCEPGAKPIDIVDIGMPNDSYVLSTAQARVRGVPCGDIRVSEYVKPGVEVHLDDMVIMPGDSATLSFSILVPKMLHQDRQDQAYASFMFSPTWYGSQYTVGSTYLECNFVFPPGTAQDEPRYHETAFTESWYDSAARAPIYRWLDDAAAPDRQYTFGASFPSRHVAAGSVQKPPPFLLKVFLGIAAVFGAVLGFLFHTAFFWIFGLIIFFAVRASKRRQMKYLPPQVSIEGVGIKRGLTAPEAGILLEMGLDRVLTMVLFGLVKKQAMAVTEREPKIKVKVLDAARADQPYEKDFLAGIDGQGLVIEKQLRECSVNLIKAVNDKLKGFSRKETVAYYRSIISQAWDQVKAAGTPELKVQAMEENYDWMMMDHDYQGRVHDHYGTGYYPVPRWWPYYYPGRTGTAGPSAPAPSGPGGQVQMPKLPGADFANTVTTGLEKFSAGLVGKLDGFTSKVTQVTNPVPVSSGSSGGSSSGGGRSSCACACACAGCACACAGGGR